MTRELEVLIGPKGEIRFVHDDDLASAFADEQTFTSRASRVEPSHEWCPHCGQVIGHKSDCEYERFETLATTGWAADLAPVGGPVLGPFARRADALAAEVAWLKEAMARGEANVR